MSQFVTKTEELDDSGVWTPANSLTVTPNTFAGPAGYGSSVGMADTLTDTTAAAQGLLIGSYYAIPADTAFYCGSWHIRKDAVVDRWPEVVLNINTGPIGSVQLNTSTGAIDFGNAPVAYGFVDVDANYWRVWVIIQNDGAGTDVRIYTFPDHLDGLGGPATAVGTGSAAYFGANITAGAALQDYVPDPFYQFGQKFLLTRP